MLLLFYFTFFLIILCCLRSSNTLNSVWFSKQKLVAGASLNVENEQRFLCFSFIPLKKKKFLTDEVLHEKFCKK